MKKIIHIGLLSLSKFLIGLILLCWLADPIIHFILPLSEEEISGCYIQTDEKLNYPICKNINNAKLYDAILSFPQQIKMLSGPLVVGLPYMIFGGHGEPTLLIIAIPFNLILFYWPLHWLIVFARNIKKKSK